MSVYTQLSLNDASALLQKYDKGPAIQLLEIQEGIENTNYFVQNQDEEWLVLTIFEQVDNIALPFFLEVMDLAADAGLPAPKPFRDKQNIAIHFFKQKAFILVPRLEGKHCSTPTKQQCQQIGAALAAMHNRTGDSTLLDPAIVNIPQRDVYWVEQIIPELESLLSPNEFHFLKSELKQWQRLRANKAIPIGAIHGDLFHDNALFVDDTLTGVIDFYNASIDQLLLDLAIVVNDWCSDKNGILDSHKYLALIQGYQEIRPFTDAEKLCWPEFLCAASLRFWVSRLWVQAHNKKHPDRPWAGKDPNEYKQILLARRAERGRW